jgi:uncharacterized protein YndB with AHSA1/START domain
MNANMSETVGTKPTLITVESRVNAPVAKVWKYWTTPEDIMQWNAASDDWHTPSATNDLRVGGKFTARMEAKDGSMGFDFAGIYTEVRPHELIAYRMDDDRHVRVEFEAQGDSTVVRETFVPETTHSIEMQRGGWQSILDSFKAYVERQR